MQHTKWQELRAVKTVYEGKLQVQFRVRWDRFWLQRLSIGLGVERGVIGVMPVDVHIWRDSNVIGDHRLCNREFTVAVPLDPVQYNRLRDSAMEEPDKDVIQRVNKAVAKVLRRVDPDNQNWDDLLYATAFAELFRLAISGKDWKSSQWAALTLDPLP